MHIRKLLALVLCVCLILSMIPAVAADNETLTPALTGNTGATITCSSAPLSAEVDDNDLAIVEIRGNEVRVIGKENAVGVARLTVETASGYHIFDIPIGYTTFVFNGNSLTVIPGDSANYEIAGVNSADEEYLVGDVSFPLPYTTDANGYQVFENTDTYKLCVGLKKNGGTYVFTGTGTDSCIAVKKAAVNPTTILLAGLDLTSSFTAPIAVKKESTTTATITALGGFVNTLTDNPFNNADNYGDPTEDGGDGTNTAYAESAVIKGKSYSNVTLNGAGTLNLVCTTKNALKVGVYGALTIDELTLNITSAKNGISSDNTMVINGGNISVTTSTGDCIRTDPDAVDASAGCAADIVINGGTFNLQAASDGIQSAQNLTINGGDFTIQTMNGYNDSSFDKDTMSCKGIKGTNPSDDETTEGTNVVTINGGTFNLNTADDALHSDGTMVITGGEFTIQTGDDGAHADIQADFGAQNAADCKLHMTINNSYEGLESRDVYIWSGCYNIIASDDGINAAGGSSSGTDPGGGGWDPWNPGGGGSSGGDYSLNIKGGLVNVNCNGDGLDSNGALNITGGSSIVWAQSPNGDNSPLDTDGTMTVNGGMVFGGGTNPMNENPSTSTSQPYVTYGGSSGGGWGGGGGSSSTISSGKTVVVKNASSQVVFSIKAPKNINYAIYSAPSMTTSTNWSITSDNSTPTCTGFWQEHSYGSYSQTTAPTCTVPGVKTAACSVCGSTQTQEIAATGHTWSYVTIAPTETLEGYDLYTCSVCGGQYRTNFVDPLNGPNPCMNGHTWDAGVVTVQPTCTEDGVTTYTCTVCGETSTTASPAALGHAFNETTGVCERCGAEAFRITYVCVGGVSVTAFPSQDLTTGGVPNATTVFVRNSGGGIDISGSGQANFLAVLEEGYGVASVEVTPAGSYNAIKYPTDIGVENAYRVTKINQDVTITITAEEGLCEHEFDEDGFCIHCGLEAPKAVFVTDGGASVTAYPTQDLTTGGVVNATVALARNSDTGEVDLNGNGQVNFVVNLNDGYVLESVTAEPAAAYNKFKDNGDGSYRLTKVNATVTVTVTTSVVMDDPVDVYFVDQDDNATAYFYAFGNGNQNAAFPGEAMTAVGVDENGDNYYKITLDRSVYTNVIFSGGASDTQTADLGLGDGDYIVYYVNGHTGYVGADLWPAPATVVEATCTEAGSVTYTGLLTGETHVTETPALGHLPGEAVEENRVEPTATEAGHYDSVVYCQRCGAELSRETVEIPATGPAEPVETDALRIYNSISVGTDMVITFTARKTDLTNYADFWIEVVKHNPDGDETYTYPMDQLTEGNSTWAVQFRNIYAKEMGIDVEARLYAEDAAGQIYMSPAKNANIRDYLGGRLTATNNKVQQRVLAADMLNYGAAAQLFMDFQTDHLVNEELTSDQLAKLHEYETTELPAVNKTNSNYRPEGESNILFTSVTLGNEVLLNLTVRLAEGTEGVQVLVKDHETGETVKTLDTAWGSSTFSATFNGIGADAMRTEFDLVTVVNGVETGNTRTWSVEAYVGEVRAENRPLKTAMANALLTYGDSAAAYFAAQ